jgi:hypothetical protein
MEDSPKRDSGPRVLMIVNSFPESQPQIQNTQSAGQTPHEAAGNEVAQPWPGQKKRIIGPARRPRKNNQQHAKRGAQGDEQQRAEAKKPYFHGCRSSMRSSHRGSWGVRGNGMRLARCGRGRSRRLEAQYATPDPRLLHARPFKSIWLFYGLRALMRSATSR